MTIGFDAKRAFRNSTGLGNYSRMLVCGLALRDPQTRIVLYTPSTKGRYAHTFDGMPNVEVVTPQGLWRWFPRLWRTFGIGLATRRHTTDIFHGLSHELPTLLPKRVKQVVTMHDMIVWRYPSHFGIVDRIIYKTKQRNAARRADRIVAISRQTAADVAEYLHCDPAKIEVVYQSCDPIFMQPADSTRRGTARERYGLPDHYVICIGTIETRKNQKAVVEAMAYMPEDLHLVIVGRTTPYFDTVKSRAEELGLSSRVLFIHNADFSDFPLLYAEADASVYMSLFEGFGIPVLESLWCGTPVVTSNSSSLPEVGGDAALYADPNKPAEIAERLRSVLYDNTVRNQLLAAAKRQRELFSTAAIVDNFIRLYNSLLD